VQEDFFIELHSILAEREEVTELHPVPDAHVPVMKFKFNGISIDLLYARLSLWAIPDVSFSVNYQRHLSAFVGMPPRQTRILGLVGSVLSML
jgi:poly(A) polymerase Pap1